jgi:hypothetical protein
MGKVISIHEYELKPDVEVSDFEHALHIAEDQELFQLPGLVGRHFIKGLKGSRIGKFAAIWVYESRDVWEDLWGPPDQPRESAEYPENWQKWEKLLEHFLAQDPDEIVFTAYEEV